MKLSTASCLAVLSLAAAVCLVPADRADGCAVAPHHGDTVQIADESAIIIWDAASKTEHFIRRASFTAKAKDFGFLVPTPEKPELAEAGDEAFATLADLTKPRVVTQSRPPSGGGGCGCGAAKQAANEALAPAGVEVLESKRVGRYHADVLKADDAGALSNWLKEHGYEVSPQIKEWAEPYVAKKWVISAFKIAPDDAKAPPEGGATARGDTAPAKGKDGPAPSGGSGSVSTAAVRMTFHTERPFFPYREPPSPPSADPHVPPPRLLRVYFLADARVKGTLGEGGRDWSNTATAHVVWANRLQDPARETTLEQLKLPKDTPPASCWLTEFEDRSSPRPGTDDVYFAADPVQAPVERPPTVQYVSTNLPGCVMCYALALYLFLPCLVRHARGTR